MRRIVVVVMGVLLAACGGSKAGTQPADLGRPAGTPTEKVTSTIKTATVNQIASIVAKYQTDLRRYAAAAIACEVLIDSRCTATTRIMAATLLPTASTLDVELRGAAEDRPNNKLFIGAYPAELVSLVSRMRAALDEVAKAGEAGSKAGCTIGTTGDACPTPYLLLADGASHVVRQLDAWSPYIR